MERNKRHDRHEDHEKGSHKNNSQIHKIESQHSAHAVSATKRGLLFSFVLTGLFFAVELVVGLQINSVAVLADAAHNFSAAAGVGIALFAILIASKPATPKRTFGFLKAEIFSAWINGMLLIVMAYMIFSKGIHNFLNPVEVQTLPMIILAFIGLAVGGIPAIMLYKKQKTDTNVKGAFWHVMETLFGSAAVLMAAVTVNLTGWVQADAFFGMLLAPVLFLAAYGIIKESTRSLLDLTPKDLDLAEIKREIEKNVGVINAHHIHAWALTDGRRIFSSHIKVQPEAEKQSILKTINSMLKEKYNIYFATIQQETECTDQDAEEIDFV